MCGMPGNISGGMNCLMLMMRGCIVGLFLIYFTTNSAYVCSHLPAAELHKVCWVQYQVKLASLKGAKLDQWMQELVNESGLVGSGSFENGLAACRVSDVQDELLSLVHPI